MASAPVILSVPPYSYPLAGMSFGHKRLFLLAVAVLLASPGFAQGTPRVTAVEPSSGKVNNNVTVIGDDVGKGTVSAAFLSDDTTDHKATLAEQGEGKIVMKVPQVKAGDCKVSFHVGNNVYIQPCGSQCNSKRSSRDVIHHGSPTTAGRW